MISSQISAPEHPLEMEESIRENVEVEVHVRYFLLFWYVHADPKEV